MKKIAMCATKKYNERKLRETGLCGGFMHECDTKFIEGE